MHSRLYTVSTHLHSFVVIYWYQVVVRGEGWEGGRSEACEGGGASPVRSGAEGGMAVQMLGLGGVEDAQWPGEVGVVWHL